MRVHYRPPEQMPQHELAFRATLILEAMALASYCS
jgi:hypothetical protein